MKFADPSFSVTGMITEMRPLVGAKSKEIWTYSVHIATIGDKLECRIDKDSPQLYKSVGMGQNVEVHGHIAKDFSGKSLALMITSMKVVKDAS